VQEKYGAIDGGSRVSTRADGCEVVDVKGKEKEREENAPAVWIRECLLEDADHGAEGNVAVIRLYIDSVNPHLWVQIIQ
jgi:hypothetical protein